MITVRDRSGAACEIHLQTDHRAIKNALVCLERPRKPSIETFKNVTILGVDVARNLVFSDAGAVRIRRLALLEQCQEMIDQRADLQVDTAAPPSRLDLGDLTGINPAD